MIWYRERQTTENAGPAALNAEYMKASLLNEEEQQQAASPIDMASSLATTKLPPAIVSWLAQTLQVSCHA